MNELKPVAKINDEFGQVLWLTLPIFKPETPIYIIPDTHRVVSVELLNELDDSIYTHYKIRKQVRAIIDNKVTT